MEVAFSSYITGSHDSLKVENSHDSRLQHVLEPKRAPCPFIDSSRQAPLLEFPKLKVEMSASSFIKKLSNIQSLGSAYSSL